MTFRALAYKKHAIQCTEVNLALELGQTIVILRTLALEMSGECTPLESYAWCVALGRTICFHPDLHSTLLVDEGQPCYKKAAMVETALQVDTHIKCRPLCHAEKFIENGGVRLKHLKHVSCIGAILKGFLDIPWPTASLSCQWQSCGGWTGGCRARFPLRWIKL